MLDKGYYRNRHHDVMEDTYQRCSTDCVLRDAVSKSIKEEYVVFEDDMAFKDYKPVSNPNMKVLVTKRKTLVAAKSYKNSKVCALDFANCHSPGGSPWSSGAQEESLCQVSTLYPCIFAQQTPYFVKHVNEFKCGAIDHMGTDDMIYVPDVLVFKDDESSSPYKDLDRADWYGVDIIVAAAPELFGPYDIKEYEKVMTKRIKRILDIADKAKVQSLVLGAFGCGAFNNPPKVVAKIFASLIRSYSFDTVEFAVYCRSDDTNYQVFREVIANDDI